MPFRKQEAPEKEQLWGRAGKCELRCPCHATFNLPIEVEMSNRVWGVLLWVRRVQWKGETYWEFSAIKSWLKYPRDEQGERVNLRCLIELITTMGNRGSVLLGTSEEPCIMCSPIFHPSNIKRQHLFIGSSPKWSRYAPWVVNAFALPDLCLCQNDWKGSQRYLLGWKEGNPRKELDLWGRSLQFTSEYNWVPQ